MIRDLGIIQPGTTLYIPFHTFDSNDPSASVTMTGLATTDIEIYKDGSTTQRASDAGYALLDTDGIDFDTITGIHGISINLADNTTAGFYAAGSQYWVVLSSITVDAATINFVLCTFRIGYIGATLNTTIATLASQTSFTLTAGPAEDDALNNCQIVIHDVASAVQVGRAIISDYTGSTKTVTLAAGTTFTAAATDNVSVLGLAPLIPTTAGRTLDVSTGGEAGVDWANVGTPGSTVSLSATTVATVTTTGTATNVTTVNALAANTITATSIATGAITAAKFAAGAIDAAAIANNAIDAATFAADVDAEFLSYLVDDATRIDASALNTASVTSIPAILVDTGTTLQAELDGIQADTEDIQTRLPAALVGGRIDATVDGTGMEAGATAAIAVAVWDSGNIDGYTHSGALSQVYTNTGDVRAGLVLAAGTIGATGNSTTALHLTGLTYGDDELNDCLIVITDDSTGERHARWITDWADTGDLATVATLPFTPENSVDTYVVLSVRRDVTGSGGLDAAGVRAALGMASADLDTQLDAIKADTAAILTDTGTTLQGELDAIEADVDTLLSRLGTPSDLGGGATVAANLSDIESQTDDIGAAGAGLTALATAAELAKVPKSDGTATWNATALASINTQADLALSDYDPPTNAEMVARTLAAADYATATALQTVDNEVGAIDTVVDAILVDTNELQTDWVNGGRLDLILDARASQTSVDDLPTNAELAASQASADDATLAAIAALNNLSAAQVNAEVDAAIETYHLDHLFAATYDPASKPGAADALLNELVESDAGVSRFSANTLEQAPTGGSAPTVEQIADEVQTRTIAAVTTVTTTTNLTNLPTIPANWLTAAGTAADFTTEIQSGLATAASIAALNNLSAAQVNAEVDAALADYDGPTNAEMVARTPSATAIANVETVFNTDFASNYNTTVDAWNASLLYWKGDSMANAVAGSAPAHVYTMADNVITAAKIADNAIDTATFAAGTTLPRVTLVDTTTTNTDMRGTDNAALAATALSTAVWTAPPTGFLAATFPGTVASPTNITAGTIANVTNPVTTTDTANVTAILADTNELQADWVNGGRLDLLIDAIKAKTDNLPAAPAATGDIPTVSQIWTTALVEAYRSVGDAGTPAQLLHEIIAHLGDSSISGTTKTLKNRAGTSVKTFTLNSATIPTAIEELS